MFNPALGVLFHWIGGLASGSFYVPFRFVRFWSWETFWLTGGIFSWIIAPWGFAYFMTNDLIPVLRETPVETHFWSYFFGLLWGLGGLTFGLTMRYLGMSLGMAMVLGYCAAFGTLVPPIFSGEFTTTVLGTAAGRVVLLGIAVCMIGIAVAGLAGISKEREMSSEQKQAVIKEFNLRKGVLVATFSGVMSACFSFGLAAGEPIKKLTLQHGTAVLWQGLPVLVVVLLGGFTTNFLWCLMLNVRNKTGHEYFSPELETTVSAAAMEASAHGAPVTAGRASAQRERVQVPMLKNYLFCAIAGTTWYFQFFFYSMGETQMGVYKFSSWTLHMASIIIFSSIWGLVLHEWRGAGKRTMRLLFLSLAILVGSTLIVGYGNYLGSAGAPIGGSDADASSH
ncbi:MAG: L-rhamnose/proton symporter RhaT [Bryobacteraceae bacterium]|nr:L-rhamnose/proton symporter RhaT [Bryobacteraceae bacterium]